MFKNIKDNIMNIILISLVVIGIFVAILIFIVNPTGSNNDDNTTKTEVTTSNTKETAENTTDTQEKIEKPKDPFEGLALTNNNIGVPVLYYHSVDPSEANEVTISPSKLKEQLKFIKDSGYTTLTMAQLNDYLINNKPIPEKSIMITFDDGYMDNYNNAFPILKELQMNATIFVITSGIDDGYYMSSKQLKEMSDYGIDIESHTVNHLHLNQLSYEKQLEELKNSRDKLKILLNKDVTAVAYPFGDLNDNTKKAVKNAGYTLAFTTNRGYSDRDDSAILLDRIYVSSKYTMDEFKDRLLNTKK
jgi:peptidoglycan/xylan/chitin deacetylase (PgdA/CDA1 family)